MDLSSLLLFIPACFALNMAPGPNNLLSLHNASRYGLRTACVAGGGRIVAFSGMIALAAMGLAVVLHTSEYLFLAIKVVGAAYLFYIAWQLWRAPVGEAVVATDHPRGTWRLTRQEFWVAAGNPSDAQYSLANPIVLAPSGASCSQQYRGGARQQHRADAVEKTFAFGFTEPAAQVQPDQCIACQRDHFQNQK
ncbi:LysE family translocator [Pseudomonas putida]|uniref:LysE family translocator n=1 Tax=Pseudomonas putida TaxID=303 RepID=UPI0026A24966